MQAEPTRIPSSSPNPIEPGAGGPSGPPRSLRLKQTFVLLRREYVARIKSKGFWLSTLILPIFMFSITVLPTLVMSRVASEHTLALVDESGRIAPILTERLTSSAKMTDRIGEVGFQVEPARVGPEGADALRAELDRRVLDGEIDAWLWVDDGTLEDSRAAYHAASVSNFQIQAVLREALSASVREIRLGEAGIDRELVEALSEPVQLATSRVSEDGSREETGEAGFFLAIAVGILIYMVLLIYGNQVMTGVLEEKSSRVVEVLLSTVRPFELMMGKLGGICLVVLTQLGIWLVTAVVLTAPGLLQAIGMMGERGLPTIPLHVLVHIPLHFLMGYFVYATFYAAIGASFNNVQEAQQTAGVAVAFVIAPMMIMFPVINDPDSLFAQVASLIPFFTPILMIVRIAVKTPPAWQIALGYALTSAFGVFMVWLAARIYRVGILMHGKKPTLKEMWRWLRYS